MRENLGDYKSAATAYKRAIAEAPTADLGLLEVHLMANLPSGCWSKSALECICK